ncbi:MAG: hypothetical protein ACI8QS_002374 [Planctomycetota bacterium]|jgi:hypothetical protein
MELCIRKCASIAISLNFAALVLGGGAAAQGISSSAAPSQVEVDGVDLLIFKGINAGAGLTSTYTKGNTHTGGSAWVDYNGDLLPDLFISNGTGLEHFLYRNDGGGKFTDVSYLVPKSEILDEDAGVKYADIDNDGDEDILVIMDSPVPVVPGQPVNPPEGGTNLLYLNDGAGGFTEVGLERGVVHPLGRRTICSGFADYDNDGFIDLYLGSWTIYGLPLGVIDDYDRLLRNDGTGVFLDASAATGVDGLGVDALVMQWLDTDFDLFPDIYVGVAAHVDLPPLFPADDIYYRNSDGQSFTNDLPNQPWVGDDAVAAMGIAAGDFDNDGDWDLYITDTYAKPPAPLGNVLYLGSPDGSFTENAAADFGVSFKDSWSCGFADLNNDKWSDLWIGSMNPSFDETAFLNKGNGTFQEVVVSGFGATQTRGGSSSDYDGDGDVDLFFVNHSKDSVLYRNDTVTTGGWIEFKLYGTLTNRGAIGTVVYLESGGVNQMRSVSGGDSAHSQSDAILHFGTGQDPLVDITIRWPSGTVQVFEDLSPDDLYLIDESAGLIAEDVTDAGITWDATGLVLQVAVDCTFGGRASLDASGLGVLTFDAAQGAYVGTFTGLSTKPADVTITSERGGLWTIPVP